MYSAKEKITPLRISRGNKNELETQHKVYEGLSKSS